MVVVWPCGAEEPKASYPVPATCGKGLLVQCTDACVRVEFKRWVEVRMGGVIGDSGSGQEPDDRGP